jgi:hypothetical protein
VRKHHHQRVPIRPDPLTNGTHDLAVRPLVEVPAGSQIGRRNRADRRVDEVKPVFSDRLTGYRYYSAEQMPILNRILALKDLGLSLDQIKRTLSNPISTDLSELLSAAQC